MVAASAFFFPHLARVRARATFGHGIDEHDENGTPCKYFDCGSTSERTGGSAPRSGAVLAMLKLGSGALSAALVGRTDLIGALGLALHSIGYTPPGLLEAAKGQAPLLIFMYLALSFIGAAYGYYKHCSAIEAWCDAQPASSYTDWKIQKADTPLELRSLARKLGTLNAGCAAVYGTASTLAALHGGFGLRLYFSIAEYGVLWYLLTWPLFFTWVECYAYFVHRLFHTKPLYKRFHKLHHKFNPPTAFTAVAFHPVEFAVFVFGGQLVFFVMPVHPSVMLTVGLYTARHLIEDHTGIRNTPTWPWQCTTTFHDDHHQHFHCNFGQHVLWFDHLFGTMRSVKRTYAEEDYGGKGKAKAT